MSAHNITGVLSADIGRTLHLYDLSLLFLDADSFKRYNDGYGHQEGDELLKTMALAIKQKARRPRDGNR